jgi:hypothetical protein
LEPAPALVDRRGLSGARAKLQSMAVESKAVALTDRIDALGAALRAAGVSQEQSSTLLAAAAAATMHALTLDALLEDAAPRPGLRPAAVAALDPDETRVRLAA